MEFCVYEQFFSGRHPGNGTPRHGARAALLVSTGEGRIRYVAALSFFPHESEDDFRISYDIYAERVLYEANGRRSRTREASLQKDLRPVLDELAFDLGGAVFWDDPLIPARLG